MNPPRARQPSAAARKRQAQLSQEGAALWAATAVIVPADEEIYYFFRHAQPGDDCGWSHTPEGWRDLTDARDQLLKLRETSDPQTRKLLEAVVALDISDETLILDDDDPDGAGYLVLNAPYEVWQAYIEARDGPTG